jgi:hypothetical protein
MTQTIPNKSNPRVNQSRRAAHAAAADVEPGNGAAWPALVR